MISVNEVVRNLEGLRGRLFDENDVICEFEDFEEGGETDVIVSDLNQTRNIQNGEDVLHCNMYSAHINVCDSTEFLIAVDQSSNIIVDAWEN